MGPQCSGICIPKAAREMLLTRQLKPELPGTPTESMSTARDSPSSYWMRILCFGGHHICQ